MFFNLSKQYLKEILLRNAERWQNLRGRQKKLIQVLLLSKAENKHMKLKEINYDYSVSLLEDCGVSENIKLNQVFRIQKL